MKRDFREFSPSSLSQHFEPTENYVGCFGWVCGYSADTTFLNDAMDRFTHSTQRQRAHWGRISLVLLLDPGESGISIVEAPGVAHLPIRDYGKKLFRLMHAKVAILGFRHEKNPQDWQLRLIVSTGNWTRQTLEESIDLVWRLDLSSQDLDAATDDTKIALADFCASWKMLRWLRRQFDSRILFVTPSNRKTSDPRKSMHLFQSWIKSTSGKSHLKSRFVDNRNNSLLVQLPKKVRSLSKSNRRNYVALGSGFYESNSEANSTPSVLTKLINTLRENRLCSKILELDLYVNPDQCQGVAVARQAIERDGFTIRLPGSPLFLGEDSRRTLHAKFIFSANETERSRKCGNAWLYLGSGNLTGPGFANKMSPTGGNLEAGVIFVPGEDLYWYAKNCPTPVQLVTNVLPLQWESDVSDPSVSLHAGDKMPERQPLYISRPVSWLYWSDNAQLQSLQVPGSTYQSFDVLNDGVPCERSPEGFYIWNGERPREVTICWRGSQNAETKLIVHTATVPVVDEFGRVGASTLLPIGLDEAWASLQSFPEPPDEEELPDEERPDQSGRQFETSPNKESSSSYPIRQMMQLIENIAAKQSALTPIDWSSWCIQLEQCLILASNHPSIAAFREMKINPLSPLREVAFRPAFGENDTTIEGKQYESVLQRIELAWNVRELRSIGGLQ